MFRKSHDSVRLALEPEAVEVLVGLFDQMLELIDAPEIDPADPFSQLVGIDKPVAAPADPALLRLLPNAYPDDLEAAADFRRYTDSELRGAKAAHARTARDMLANWHGAVLMDQAQARGWLLALNDLRLVLGTRLGIGDNESEDDSEDEGDDSADPSQHLYSWLTYLQGTLVDAITN
jgi:hypothetical protein